MIYEWNRSKQLIIVAAYDSAQQAWIENIDNNADGTMDVRMTDFAGRRAQKVEVQLGSRWLEVVKQNNRSGTILDGRFMSVDEARTKLSNSIKPK